MVLGENTLIGGAYRLEKQLGEGSMGDVWRARHEETEQAVAIKLLRSDRSQLADLKRRFEREATTTARLRSRHVVEVFDHGVHRGQPYLVMELLHGEDLDEELQRSGPASHERTVTVLRQAAEGLQHAHDAGIIHRDLKPANLFLSKDDGEEVVKILDFGVAKALVPEPGKRATAGTAMGAILGSPFYMSPEHIEGRWDLVDHRADLWSLAVIAFRMLTGRLPFEAEGLPALLTAITSMVPYHATLFRPELPPEIDAFFARAFAKDRTYRFDGAVELVAALAEALGVDGPTSDEGARDTLPTEEPSTAEARVPPSSRPDASSGETAPDPDLDPTEDLPPRRPVASLPLPTPPPRSSRGSLTKLGATTALPGDDLVARLGDEAPPPSQTPAPDSDKTQLYAVPAAPDPHPEAEGERTMMLSDDAATAMWQVPPPPDAPTVAVPRPPAPTLPGPLGHVPRGAPSPRLVTVLVVVGVVAVLALVGVAAAILAG